MIHIWNTFWKYMGYFQLKESNNKKQFTLNSRVWCKKIFKFIAITFAQSSLVKKIVKVTTNERHGQRWQTVKSFAISIAERLHLNFVSCVWVLFSLLSWFLIREENRKISSIINIISILLQLSFLSYLPWEMHTCLSYYREGGMIQEKSKNTYKS